MDTQRLTQQLYDRLLTDGYEYLLLKDVQEKDSTVEIIYEPLRKTPSGTQYSCTSIRDDMIKGPTQNNDSHIKIYIELDEAA